MADETLRTLVAVSRSKPIERELCCPECGGDVHLVLGMYVCGNHDGWASEHLAELAVKEKD